MPRHGSWPKYWGTAADARKCFQLTRQQRRRIALDVSLNNLRQSFGGFTDLGGFYWPLGMPRKVARKIAIEQARKVWREQ